LKQLRLTIDSNLEHVALIGLAINKICEHLRMDEVQCYQVELCAVEALTNSIRHAYQNAPGHEVVVILSITDDRLQLEICDEGKPMGGEFVQRLRDGSRVFEFDPSDIAAVPEGGMGLQIMHEVMDEVSYSGRTAGGSTNRLCLTKRLNHAHPQAC
jgi:serine/threonine-protein kinase RsbW